jgi:hypothetical protein
VYPDPRVADYVTGRFVPVRVHVKDQRDEYKRLSAEYGVQWTPTTLILDEGEERHRIEGFLPADDFLSQLMLGTARAAFTRKDHANAERLYREVVTQFPNTEAAAEALYWAGVSKYRATNDPAALKETARAFEDRYQSTSWAKKASVWRRE